MRSDGLSAYDGRTVGYILGLGIAEGSLVIERDVSSAWGVAFGH